MFKNGNETLPEERPLQAKEVYSYQPLTVLEKNVKWGTKD
jgi:hypothetical protein